jgi:hypothetical protein
MFLAQRLEISERIDRGVLTEGQGQIEGTRLFQQAIAQIQERQRSAMANVQAVAQANAVAAAQARAAAGQEQAARSAATTNALLGASAFFAEMGRPSRLPYGAYQLPNNVITCNRNGTTTTCF